MISREESLLNSTILLGKQKTQNGLSQYKNNKSLKYTQSPMHCSHHFSKKAILTTALQKPHFFSVKQ